MRVGCLYTVERAATPEKPLPFAMDIPFGMAMIVTLLRRAGHEVDLFVFSRESQFREALATYVERSRPALFCCTAVSTQFGFVAELTALLKQLDPSIYIVVGGHHASLDSEEAIRTPSLDAICVGEGDRSILPLVESLQEGRPPTGLPHLWFRGSDSTVERNPPLPFEQDLDALPLIDRTPWEPWIAEPERFPSILLGRGCPFQCTYCSSHAMQRLSSGRFVRLRSPASIVEEIRAICSSYPSVDSVYLEVETIAHQKEAEPLFEALADFNGGRTAKLSFGLNFTITSTFIRDERRCREFLRRLRRANVVYLNVGLESGSERLRRDVLRRPKYTNEEFVRFARLAREHGLNLDLYVLMGVPGETLADYLETVALVRRAKPTMVFLSIFYPYLGTDLCRIAIEQGLLSRDALNPRSERARSALDLPGFSRRRVRLEYLLFWLRVYRGVWPMARIVVETARGVANGSPRLWRDYMRIRERSTFFKLARAGYRAWLHRHGEPGVAHRPQGIDFTYAD